MSCEILTSDVTQINDALGEDESLLRRLYGFLQTGSILNPLLASFFSKVMGILINRKTDQVGAFATFSHARLLSPSSAVPLTQPSADPRKLQGYPLLCVPLCLDVLGRLATVGVDYIAQPFSSQISP